MLAPPPYFPCPPGPLLVSSLDCICEMAERSVLYSSVTQTFHSENWAKLQVPQGHGMKERQNLLNERMGSFCVMGTGFMFEMMRNFWRYGCE